MGDLVVHNCVAADQVPDIGRSAEGNETWFQENIFKIFREGRNILAISQNSG